MEKSSFNKPTMSFFSDRIHQSLSLKDKLLQDAHLLALLEDLGKLLTKRLQANQKIWFCGNGGSAADAQHLAAEFSGRFYIDRNPLPAEAMHVNTSYLTAVANDYGYEYVYARYLASTAKAGDVLVGLSTSGNSSNILRAFEKARELGITTIGFTGTGGGKMAELSDFLVAIPSSDTPRIQECHMLLGHCLCEWVEKSIFG